MHGTARILFLYDELQRVIMALDKALDIVTQTLPHSKKNFDTINLNALNSQLI